MPTYPHQAEESDYLHFSKGMWMKGVLLLQYPHFSDFCVRYSSAFCFKQFSFSYRFANNTLFSFALLGGTLCKWNHTKYIIQRLAVLGSMFLRFIHTDVYNCSSCFCTAVKYCIVWVATVYFSIL